MLDELSLQRQTCFLRVVVLPKSVLPSLDKQHAIRAFVGDALGEVAIFLRVQFLELFQGVSFKKSKLLFTE
jgi:hypothetical protein